MWIVLLLMIAVYVGMRNGRPAQTTRSAAALTGGRHIPPQTLTMGGRNLRGNAFDNGTTQTILNAQSSGVDSAPGNMVYATAGGEDGQDPALPLLVTPRSQITTFSRFQILSGDQPSKPDQFSPPGVDDINPVVRRG